MRVCDTRNHDQKLLQGLREAECDSRSGGLHVLPEAGHARIDLADSIAMEMRDARCWTVTTEDMRLSAQAQRQIENRVGMAMRRDLGERDENQADRGKTPPSQHQSHSRISFVS